MKKSIPVTLFGQSFMLRSDSSPDEVQRVAEFVNQAIDEVAAASRVTNSMNVVLLAFLNVAQSYLQLQSSRRGEEQELLLRMNRLAERLDDELGYKSGSRKI